MQQTPDKAWIGWPERGCWGVYLRYFILLNLLWLLVYGGASWITSLHDYRIPIHFAWEMQIPFLPAAAPLYLSLFPLLWIAPFLLLTVDRLRALARDLARLILLSGVGFLLVPCAEIAPTLPTTTGFCERCFYIADWINMEFNCFPSLHVSMSVLCALTYSRPSTPWWAKTFFATWALAISLSTLLTRQHYVMDVIGGAFLACLVFWMGKQHSQIARMDADFP